MKTIALALTLGLVLFSSTAALAASGGAALDIDEKGQQLLQINGELAFTLFEELQGAAKPAADWNGALEKSGRHMRCLKKADWAFCELRINSRRGAILRVETK